MANLPRKPQTGDKTLQSMYNAICNIIDYLPSLEVRGDNRTIKVNSFGSGKTLEVIGRTSGSAPSSGSGTVVSSDPDTILAQVRTWDPVNGSTVNLYPNGKEGASVTGKIYCPELSATSKLNAGDWILAHKLLVLVTGGND